MPGCQVIGSHFWPLSCTILMRTGNLVCISISLNVYTSLKKSSEELLLDFCELHGEHSGENLAATV